MKGEPGGVNGWMHRRAYEYGTALQSIQRAKATKNPSQKGKQT